jgi:hypothetical protein
LSNSFTINQQAEVDTSDLLEIAYQSRKWEQGRDSTSQTFVYHLCNADLDQADVDYGAFFAPNDDVGLAKYVYANFPATRNFVTPDFDIVLFISSIKAEEKADGWELTLTYSLPDGRQATMFGGYVQLAYNTNGETTNIKMAKSVQSIVSRTDISTLPPETYGLIGATKDGIEGIDISDPGLSFSITAYYTPLVWNSSVALVLAGLTKTYNNALFYGFPAGEVLLDYVDAQGEAYKMVPVTFYFIRKPNLVNVPNLPFPPLTMLGHDVLDYLYEKAADNNKQVIWPSHRKVLRVRDPGNFNLLGV